MAGCCKLQQGHFLPGHNDFMVGADKAPEIFKPEADKASRNLQWLQYVFFLSHTI